MTVDVGARAMSFEKWYAKDDIRPIKAILSPVLLAVAQGIVAGKTNAQIARDRGTTENVVKQYTHRIFEATGCASRLELANRYAFENLDELRGTGGVVVFG